MNWAPSKIRMACDKLGFKAVVVGCASTSGPRPMMHSPAAVAAACVSAFCVAASAPSAAAAAALSRGSLAVAAACWALAWLSGPKPTFVVAHVAALLVAVAAARNSETLGALIQHAMPAAPERKPQRWHGWFV